jgi:acetyl esterase
MLQVLMSPITNVSEMNTDSYYRYATGYMLTKEWMEAFRGYYLPDACDWIDPLVSPLPAEDFAGLPPAFVITAEYDVLRDEGEAFARLLADAGVAVRHYRCGGVIHGFTTAMVDFIEQARHAVRLTADEIKLAVGR